MDVVFLGGKTLKIKGKNATIVVNPTSSISKTEADAIVLSSSLLKLVTSNCFSFAPKIARSMSEVIVSSPNAYDPNRIIVALGNLSYKNCINPESYNCLRLSALFNQTTR